jgi:hypothetical protein
MRIALPACFAIMGVLVGIWNPVSTRASGVSDHGNSAAAHTCKGSGYTTVVGTDGAQDMLFADTGQCVRYAAQGGNLVDLSGAQPCMNNGYQNLGPGGDAPVFSNEAACVLYVGHGGVPVPKGNVVLNNVPVSNTNSAGTIVLNVSVTLATDGFGFSFTGLTGTGGGTYSSVNDSIVGSSGKLQVTGVQVTGFEGSAGSLTSCRSATTRLTTLSVELTPTGSSTPIPAVLSIQVAPDNTDGNVTYLVQLSLPQAFYSFGTFSATLPTGVGAAFICQA